MLPVIPSTVQPPAVVPPTPPSHRTPTWIYFAWLAAVVVAWYYFKWPILVAGAIAAVTIGWIWFGRRWPKTAWFIVSFFQGLR